MRGGTAIGGTENDREALTQPSLRGARKGKERLERGMFYVYRLVDPRNDLTFYVGKGTGDRAWQHQRTVARGNETNPRKVAKIKHLISLGLEAKVEIVAMYDDEFDAYEHEIELISDSPTLTNMMPGGGHIKILTKDQIARQAEARAKRIKRRRGEADRLSLAKANAARAAKFSGIKGADLHAEEIARWLASMPAVTIVGADPMRLTGRDSRKKTKSKRFAKLWTPDAEPHLRTFHGVKIKRERPPV